MRASILISSHERLPLFRRTLWAINRRPPSIPFEVIVVDDGSKADILGELKKYQFNWKFIRFDSNLFEKETDTKKFWNNPSATNNIAFAHSTGDYIFLQGNEIIIWDRLYDSLISQVPQEDYFLVFPTTFDTHLDGLGYLDEYGANLSLPLLKLFSRWPLATPSFHTDCTNYAVLHSRKLWETIGGYDERYTQGLGGEDSDFVRRCRAIPGWTDEKYLRRTNDITVHQYHGGRSWHYLPRPEVITMTRWAEGERLRQEVYEGWDGTHYNRQPWPAGTHGVVDVVANF